MKNKTYLLLFIFNGLIIAILIFSQFLVFAFLPALDPGTPLLEQKDIATNFILRKSGLLFVELAIGLFACFIINKRVFGLHFKKNIWLLFSVLLVVLFSLVMFSSNYINKFH